MENMMSFNVTPPHFTKFVKEIGPGEVMPQLAYKLFARATPYGTEKHIINLFPFKDRGVIDEMGNFIIKIGENPTTMFSSHMDTVHIVPKEVLDKGACGLIRLVQWDDPSRMQLGGYIFGAVINQKWKLNQNTINKYDTIQLGGDDKCGVYIMCKMIEENIPGLYVFHVGEEVGGKGSRYIAEKNPDLVKGIQRCIAFDRKGYTDVISNQSPGRTASDEFTDKVAEQLNDLIGSKSDDFKFKGKIHGTWTDTAAYRKLIPECTNISAGYHNAHGYTEYVDWLWLSKWFLPAILKIKWDEIPATRDPSKDTVTVYHNRNYGYYESWRYSDGTSRIDATKTPYDKIVSTTPSYSLPSYELSDGYILECTEEGMKRLVEEWLIKNWQKRVDVVVKLLLDVATLKGEVEAVEQELEDLSSLIEDRDDQIRLLQDKISLSKIPKDIFVKNLATKMELIQNLGKICEKHSAMLDKEMWKNFVVLPRRQFKTLAKQLRRRNAVCTYANYVKLNEILLHIYTAAKGLNVAKDLIMECKKFIEANKNEEGLNR